MILIFPHVQFFLLEQLAKFIHEKIKNTEIDYVNRSQSTVNFITFMNNTTKVIEVNCAHVHVVMS